MRLIERNFRKKFGKKLRSFFWQKFFLPFLFSSFFLFFFLSSSLVRKKISKNTNLWMSLKEKLFSILPISSIHFFSRSFPFSLLSFSLPSLFISDGEEEEEKMGKEIFSEQGQNFQSDDRFVFERRVEGWI